MIQKLIFFVGVFAFFMENPVYGREWSFFGWGTTGKKQHEGECENIIAGKCGNTWLHYAAGNGKYSQLLLFRFYKKDLNTKNHQGKTPLYLAVSRGYKRIVKFLLEKGANPNIPDGNGSSPIDVASRVGYAEIVEELTKNGATSNGTAVCIALERYPKAYDKTGKDDKKSLDIATKQDYSKIINLLIKKIVGVPTNQKIEIPCCENLEKYIQKQTNKENIGEFSLQCSNTKTVELNF